MFEELAIVNSVLIATMPDGRRQHLDLTQPLPRHRFTQRHNLAACVAQMVADHELRVVGFFANGAPILERPE